MNNVSSTSSSKRPFVKVGKVWTSPSWQFQRYPEMASWWGPSAESNATRARLFRRTVAFYSHQRNGKAIRGQVPRSPMRVGTETFLQTSRTEPLTQPATLLIAHSEARKVRQTAPHVPTDHVRFQIDDATHDGRIAACQPPSGVSDLPNSCGLQASTPRP
jgi:hypothetical protein